MNVRNGEIISSGTSRSSWFCRFPLSKVSAYLSVKTGGSDSYGVTVLFASCECFTPFSATAAGLIRRGREIRLTG